jgi:hypothetical protein
MRPTAPILRRPPSRVGCESRQLAAAHHHHPQEAPAATRSLTWLVHFGLQLAQGAGFGFPLEPVHARRDAQALELLGLSDAALDEVQATLPERLVALQGALAD